MKKIILFLLVTVIYVSPVRSKDWDLEGIIGANYSGTSVTGDWPGEEVNSRRWSLSGDGKAIRNSKKNKWVNKLELEYGRSSVEDDKYNITSDLIFFDSIFTWKTGVFAEPYAAFNTDTQFDSFFDPVTYTESAGISWELFAKDSQTLQTRLGGALKQTVSSDSSVKKEQGMESITNYNLKLNERIRITSELKFFSGFEQDIYTRWDTNLYSQLGEFITVKLSYLLIDRGKTTGGEFFESPESRLIWGIGFSYNLF